MIFLTYNAQMLHAWYLPNRDKNHTNNSAWWYTYPPEKYEFVSWDDDIPNIWKHKVHVPNHQPE